MFIWYFEIAAHNEYNDMAVVCIALGVLWISQCLLISIILPVGLVVAISQLMCIGCGVIHNLSCNFHPNFVVQYAVIGKLNLAEDCSISYIS